MPRNTMRLNQIGKGRKQQNRQRLRPVRSRERQELDLRGGALRKGRQASKQLKTCLFTMFSP